MSEELLHIFISGVTRYFEHVSDDEVIVDTPYLVQNTKPFVYDCTGLISISGSMDGCVYFTAPNTLLRQLLESIGEPRIERDNILDIVGEVANTISGNARSQLGGDFIISVPVVIEGDLNAIHFPKDSRSYVIPINWKGLDASVVISFKK